ncbi:MAG: Fe-S-containing hydro-lyase [Thomasclavelia sp.]|jgi:fumarate hydratase subunit beta|nr:Fe-S-containing hydro-lyase [Thomasclavelia sp.]
MIKLETPLTVDKVKDLKVGDEVLLSGVIYTGRDAAHKRMFELLDSNKPLPFDPKDQTIFYVGPTPTKPGHSFGSGGPTTSGRMDKFAPRMISLGLRCMIGKGKRTQEVIDALKQFQGIYFGAIGGAGAMMSSCIKKCDVIAFEDLGPEAVRRLEVKDMPLTVIIDSKGNNLYEIGRKDYLDNYK